MNQISTADFPRFDGAWHVVLATQVGKVGVATPRHGAPETWDWPRTLYTLIAAQMRAAHASKAS